MKTDKHRLQILIGFWTLTGLAILGLNGFALLSLLDEPLAGYSSEVREVDRGFREYRELLSRNDENMTTGMEGLKRRFATAVPDKEIAPEEEKQTLVEKVKSVRLPTVTLPVLSGMATSRSVSGVEHRLAFLEDDVYAEGDAMQAFTIREISADGVLLAKGEKTWFLKRPEIAYSVNKQ